MDQTFYLLIIIGILAIVLIIILWLFRKGKAVTGEARTEYIAGLNFLLADEKDKALEKLRSTVRMDTEFIDAYIKIGDILRSQEAADGAIKIHRDLLVRPNLSDNQRIAVNKALAKDYQTAQKFPQALQACDHILDVERGNAWAKDFQLAIFEEMGDWQSAYNVVRKNSKLPKDEKNIRLACYKVEQGRQSVALNQEHDARVHFREAIKLSPDCVQGFLELADSYMRDKRPSDALDALKNLIQKNPNFPELAFARLKHVLFDLGQFGEIEEVYRDLLKSNPQVVEAQLGLAEIYEKKGEIRHAVDVCNKALSYDPDRVDVKLMLVRLQSKLGRDEKAADIASELAGQLLKDRNRYVCNVCNYTNQDYFWHCPQCNSWNTAKRRV
ncbi:MAG: tetratricopeptide repeat protein [Actinobacteria bacterium]|nr:tetratricopeptide repeat protein [Actinomycetota bacterium]